MACHTTEKGEEPHLFLNVHIHRPVTEVNKRSLGNGKTVNAGWLTDFEIKTVQCGSFQGAKCSCESLFGSEFARCLIPQNGKREDAKKCIKMQESGGQPSEVLYIRPLKGESMFTDRILSY